jgi:predicted esterase
VTHSELLGFKYRFEPSEAGTRTLLLLHGTGGDQNDLLPLGSSLDPEANLLSPRGKVLENGSPRFFRRFAEGVLDVDDLKARTHELVRFIEAAVELHELDEARITAVGYSNGANIATSTLLLHPKALAAAILLRPMFVYEPDLIPRLDGVPVFIASGRNDVLIDPRDAERLATLLENAGAEVRLALTPAGHQLDRDEIQVARAWLQDSKLVG